MRCVIFLTAPANRAQARSSNQNRADSHDEKIDGVSPDCRNGALISLLINLTESSGLSRGKEEAAVFIFTAVLTRCFNSLTNDIKLTVGKEELHRLVCLVLLSLFELCGKALEIFFILTESSFSHPAKYVLGLGGISGRGIEQ